MSLRDQHLSPAEAAKRLGVSPKALRLYEARGLLKPLRSATGWRAYGASEIAALHRILALKRLGLPLSRIAELLSRDQPAMAELLAAQEQMLAQESKRIGHALRLVRAARGKLKAGKALSLDDLIQLTKETTMTTQEKTEELKAIFDPLIEKHFSETERSDLGARAHEADGTAQGWDGLMAEARDLVAKGDPNSPAAKSLARRWMAQVNLFSQGNAALAAKAREVWKDAMADPAAAPKLPLNPEIFAFVQQAWKAAQADDAKA
ncbi:MAG TPA: MerR family transcriptional regulator [Rhizomicrobium sp.]|jgi:DNA-binding transcriptional MerR regulator